MPSIKGLLFHITNFLCDLTCSEFMRLTKGGFWAYRNRLKSKYQPNELPPMYLAFLERNCSYTGLRTEFKTTPILPHGLHGIHISNGAKIGADCIIMQNVTIGSNTLPGTKRPGSPIIGDNVFIGANATIIGGIRLGNNVRVASNACVYMDVPDNYTVVGTGRVIPHSEQVDNTFIGIMDLYKKL